MSPPPESRIFNLDETKLTRRRLFSLAAVAASAAAIGTSLTSAESASAAWGGYQNGQIPTSALKAIPWKPSDYLRQDAVDALVALNVAFVQNFGYNLPVSSAYRDYAGQVYWRNYWCSRGDCSKAAAPGTSNHGWAVAIDIGVPITGWTHPIYLWMKANAPRWGWVHPAWAEPGGSGPDEAWHWEYTGAYTQNPSETDDPVPTHQSTDYAPNVALAANTWTAIPVSGGQLYLATVGSGSVETAMFSSTSKRLVSQPAYRFGWSLNGSRPMLVPSSPRLFSQRPRSVPARLREAQPTASMCRGTNSAVQCGCSSR